MAIRLVRINGRAWAWGPIAAAIVLMSLPGGALLYGAVFEGVAPEANSASAALALFIQTLLVACLFHLGSLFSKMQAMERALRESEHTLEGTLRTLADNAGGVLWMSDPGHAKFLYVSPSYETMWGRSRESLYLEPRSFLDPILPEDRPRVVAALGALSGGRFDEHYRILTPEGSIRWVHDRGAPVRDGAGKVARIVGFAADTTHLKLSEAALVEAETRAEWANRAKNQFLAHMSHELRTPLNSIIGFAEMIEGQVLGPLGNPRYRDYAKDIGASGQQLLAFVNDILDLVETESVDDPNLGQDVDVSRVAADCQRRMSEQAAAAGVILRTEVAPGLPPLRGDGRRVERILLNLLANAIKYNRRGGRVDVAASLDAEGAIVLSVGDSGAGIPAGDIPLLLEPFGHVKDAYVRTHGGTGLGLPLVKKLVALHGGSIAIASEVGKGSVFSVRFPPARTLPRALHIRQAV